MSLNGAQHGLYEFLWRGVCLVRALDPKDAAARLALHAAWGLPASRTRWGNEEFTVWKRECLAISEPGNLQAQLDGQDQERIRRRYVIRGLLARLGRDERHLREVVRRINLAARAQPQIVRPFETMTAGELDRVIWELKRDGRVEGEQVYLGFAGGEGEARKAEGAGLGAIGADNIPF